MAKSTVHIGPKSSSRHGRGRLKGDTESTGVHVKTSELDTESSSSLLKSRGSREERADDNSISNSETANFRANSDTATSSNASSGAMSVQDAVINVYANREEINGPVAAGTAADQAPIKQAEATMEARKPLPQDPEEENTDQKNAPPHYPFNDYLEGAASLFAGISFAYFHSRLMRALKFMWRSAKLIVRTARDVVRKGVHSAKETKAARDLKSAKRQERLAQEALEAERGAQTAQAAQRAGQTAAREGEAAATAARTGRAGHELAGDVEAAARLANVERFAANAARGVATGERALGVLQRSAPRVAAGLVRGVGSVGTLAASFLAIPAAGWVLVMATPAAGETYEQRRKAADATFRGLDKVTNEATPEEKKGFASKDIKENFSAAWSWSGIPHFLAHPKEAWEDLKAVGQIGADVYALYQHDPQLGRQAIITLGRARDDVALTQDLTRAAKSGDSADLVQAGHTALGNQRLTRDVLRTVDQYQTDRAAVSGGATSTSASGDNVINLNDHRGNRPFQNVPRNSIQNNGAIPESGADVVQMPPPTGPRPNSRGSRNNLSVLNDNEPMPQRANGTFGLMPILAPSPNDI